MASGGGGTAETGAAFCRTRHQCAAATTTLSITLAMAAGISDRVWSMEEVVWPLDAPEKRAA
jgi:hypothetical protein